MPFRICKSFEIESGHMLSKHPDKCRFPHGHSRRVDIIVAADHLDGNDMVCDFRVLKSLLKDFLDAWDHAFCLNTDDPNFSFYEHTYGRQVIPFLKTDPTSEVMAKMLFDELNLRLTTASASTGVGSPLPGVRVERVRVTETSSSWAEYCA
jgi:6-pyruvoyltetrahydropterin/6-carboxytetrahydropterin synthase